MFTPPNLEAYPSRFQWLFHTNCLSYILLQTSLKSLKDLQIANKQHLALACPIPFINCTRPGTSCSWSLFSSWPLLRPPSPAQVATVFRSLCSSHQWSQAGHRQWLTLPLPGGPRASSPSGQLQTTPDYNSIISTSDTFKGQT